MQNEDLMDDKLLLEVMCDNGHMGRNEFLGQALIPVRTAVEYCSRGRSIELKLLEHEDFTPWEAGDPRTNAGGSSAAIPSTTSVHSLASLHSEDTRSVGNSSPGSRKSSSLPSKASVEEGSLKSGTRPIPLGSRDRANSGGSERSFDHRETSSLGTPDSPLPVYPTTPTSTMVGPRMGVFGRPDVIQEHGLPAPLTIQHVDHESYIGDDSTSTLSPLFRANSMDERSRTESFSLPDSISLRQLAETRQAAALVVGVSYLVHVSLDRIHGMPLVKGSMEDKYDFLCFVCFLVLRRRYIWCPASMPSPTRTALSAHLLT
jgi:hypothetical protein